MHGVAVDPKSMQKSGFLSFCGSTLHKNEIQYQVILSYIFVELSVLIVLLL